MRLTGWFFAIPLFLSGVLPLAGAHEADLAGGVFVAHHVPELTYSSFPPDVCADYGPYALFEPSDQIHRINANGEWSTWFVLAAWDEEKELCGFQFGFGDYKASAYEFYSYGTCAPGTFLEVPGAGWPGPDAGVIVTRTGTEHWSGRIVPIYYFVGYADSAKTAIPLGIDPGYGHPYGAFGGFANCRGTVTTWPAVDFGSLGINCEGRPAYPGRARYACCVNGGCLLLWEEACRDVDGDWREGFASCEPDPCSPSIYRVSPDGSGVFPTVQAALNGAMHGDIIELADGVFTGPGNRDLDFHGKAITLRSESGDPRRCTIDCEGGPDDNHRGFVISSDEGLATRIEGITVTGGYIDFPSFGAGAAVNGAAPAFVNCIIAENWALKGSGMSSANGACPVLIDCLFLRNEGGSDGGGMHCVSSFPRLLNCTFARNSAAYGGAFYCSFSYPHLTNCTIADGAASHHGAGIYCNAQSCPSLDNTIIAFAELGEAIFVTELNPCPRLSCCNLFGNAGGDWTGMIADQLGQNGNIAVDPMFCGDLNPLRPYLLHGASPCAPDQSSECGLIGAWPVGCVAPQDAAGSDSRASRPMLGAPFPNPFLFTVAVRYGVQSKIVSGGSRLDVYDSAGRLVRKLKGGELMPGTHQATWDGRDSEGREVPGGAYQLRLVSGGAGLTRQVILIR